MGNKIDVYGELNSRTGEGKLADASQIWDSTQGKFQDEINQETANDGLVSVKVEQEFTDEEKAQGRENIGAVGFVDNGAYDVTANNDNIKFVNLADLLGRQNLNTLIPTTVRKGGMSIKFVHSSDNKYVQYFLPKNEWSIDPNDWEKTNLEEEVSQLEQEILMPNEKSLKDYIINGNINESTGAILPGTPIRLTTSFYLKKVLGNYLIIDQTNSATKFKFGGYRHTQIGTAPEWIPYQTTNIIKIHLEEGYFYSLLVAVSGDINISPSDLVDVKFSYGFYDDVKSSLTYLVNYPVNKGCVKSNENSVSEGIEIGDKGKISFSVILDSFSNSGKCFVKNTPNNNIPLYIDLSSNKILFRISDSGDITINNNVLRLDVSNTIEFEWDGITNPSNKTFNLKINGETASSGNYTGAIDGTIKIQSDGSWKCVDAIWLYCKVNNEHIVYNDTFEVVDDPAYAIPIPDNLSLKYDFLGKVLPNIVSNSNETYMDLGPDPGIMVDGQVYWFANWYPNNSDAYRKINLRQYTEGESQLHVIIADIVNHTISNIPYHYITQNREQYKNCVILLSFCVSTVTPLPKNVQGINYTINGGEDTSILKLNPDIVSKVANSSRAFHYDSTIGTSPLNFIYFSDIHGDTERTRRLFELREKVSQYIDDVLFTGDSDNYPNDTTWWNDYAKQMLIALGNHEYMIEKVEGVWQFATPQQVYEKFIAPYKSYWTGVVFPDNPETGKSYYYKDYATKKVRLIALDYMEINLNPDSTQITWFTSILDDVLANHPDYHVVVAVHQCAFKTEQNFKNPFDSLDFPSDTDGVIPVGIPNAVQSFINNGGHFACYFTGHNHTDHFGLGINYPNQLNISIACASMHAAANVLDIQRVADTKSQDLFNIVSIDTYSSLIKMIRVGCDYDRQLRKKDTICFYYGNDVFDSQKTYQIGQIVLYQSKIYQFLRNYNGGGWNPAIVCEIDRLIYC